MLMMYILRRPRRLVIDTFSDDDDDDSDDDDNTNSNDTSRDSNSR